MIVHIECNRHYLHIENQAIGRTRPSNVKDIVNELPVELWNVDTKFGKGWKIYKLSSKSPHYPPKHRLTLLPTQVNTAHVVKTP